MHTKEPWYLDGMKIMSRQKNNLARQDTVVIDCVRAYMDGDDSRADMRRIVDAVNACAGITAKGLKGGAVEEMLQVLKDITFQASLAGEGFLVGYDDPVMKKARAVIAKAEGKRR